MAKIQDYPELSKMIERSHEADRDLKIAEKAMNKVKLAYDKAYANSRYTWDALEQWAYEHRFCYICAPEGILVPMYSRGMCQAHARQTNE